MRSNTFLRSVTTSALVAMTACSGSSVAPANATGNDANVVDAGNDATADTGSPSVGDAENEAAIANDAPPETAASDAAAIDAGPLDAGSTPTCGALTPPTATPPALAVGTWTNISPPGLFRPRGSTPPFGCMDIHLLACSPYVLYLTTDSEGMWKSTDGGSHWTSIGNLPTPVSPGVMAIDPNDAKHMYYVGGVRGASLGFWISTDGGDTWTEPAAFTAKADNSADGWSNDLYDVKADPADFEHVLITFHSPWNWTHPAGVLESKDGGASWSRVMPGADWGQGHSIFFLNDANTWLLGTQNDGFWRTSDGGANWTQVSTTLMQHGGTADFITPDGTLYVGAVGHVLRSTDSGMSFTAVAQGTSDGYYAVIGDGTTLYTSFGNTGANSGGVDQPYFVSPENDGTNWAPQNGQTFADGAYRMAFDPVNHVIYSANWNSGVWALKVK